jgi:hypothetical protein
MDYGDAQAVAAFGSVRLALSARILGEPCRSTNAATKEIRRSKIFPIGWMKRTNSFRDPRQNLPEAMRHIAKDR